MTLASSLLALVDSTLLAIALGSLAAWGWLLRQFARREPIIEPGLSPPGPNTAVFLMVVAAWLTISVAVPALILAGANRDAQGLAFAEQIALGTATNAALLVALPAILRAFDDRSVPTPGDSVGRVTRLTQGVVAGLIVAPVVYGLFGVAMVVWPPTEHPLQSMLRGRPDARLAVLTFVSSVLVAPAAEEWIFRRVLLGWLVRPRDPAFPVGRRELSANVVVSSAFAAVHLAQWPAPVAIFPLSMAIGWLYLRTGSLAAAIGLHAGFNAIGTLLLYHSILAGPLPIP